MKRALNIVKDVFVWLMVLAAVCMMIFTVISVTTLSNNSRSILGYRFYIVQSDSMRATDFSSGDIIIVKNIKDPSVLQEGDIISYISQNPSNFGETVTHKIRKLTKNVDGEPGFITYGTTTGSDDETIVTYSYVLGKYTGKLPGVGRFFSFLKTTSGYILCVLLPFLLLIGYIGLNTIQLFRRYKREQEQELNSQREKLEQERMKAEKMMKELLALKAQLAQNGEPQLESERIPTEELDIENLMKEFNEDSTMV